MADAWQTYPVEFRGGLVTNLSPLQQGLNQPGSATILQNFEPSVEGGYRRILGYRKFDSNALSNSGLVRGLLRFDSQVFASRGSGIFKSTGGGYTAITGSTAFPASTATAKVNGATSSTTSLAVDNNSGTIIAGMVVTGTGISGSVTVSSLSDQNNLVLSSSQSLSDNVDLTFTETSPTLGGSGKVRFATYNFAGTDKFMVTDGSGKPFTFDGTNFKQLTSLSSDFSGCSNVAIFRNHVILVNDNNVFYSAPYKDEDFSAANGGGVINVGNTVTDLIVFRDQLIIFTEKTIQRLSGSSQSNFVLASISDDLGAIAFDTAQEVGGDVMFLGPDGLRLLGGTDRIGDFGLGVVSKSIQSETTNFVNSSTSYASLVVREKSQYRLFGFNPGYTDASALGLLGTQFAGQGGEGMAWSELRGINAYVATSSYDGENEHSYFANDDGFVYELEKGNSFSGSNIRATFATPSFPFDDPRIRKTFYKAFLYTEPTGSIDFDLSLKLDFERSNTGIIQPNAISLGNTTSNVFLYGTAAFAHTALVNNGSGYAVGATSIAIDTFSGDSNTGLTTGDTFKFVLTETATAAVNGAVSSSTGVAVDNNSGTILVGMQVTGTGISGTVLVATVTDQNNLVLDTAVSLSNDVSLTFTNRNFGDTFTLTGVPTISGSAGSSTSTLAFSPALTTKVVDNTKVVFHSVGGEDAATYSDSAIDSLFETQLIGSGFTAGMRIETDNTNPAFTLDAATIEYSVNGRR